MGQVGHVSPTAPSAPAASTPRTVGRCAQLDLFVGTEAPFAATFVQTGDSVAATLAFGGLTATTNGSITVEGELELPTVTLVPVGTRLSIHLQNWKSRVDIPGLMTATFQQWPPAPSCLRR